LGVFLAVFYLVDGANALNLLDGMDGLAVGTTAIAAFFLAILASGQGKTLVFILALATLGTTLGFLPYNFSINFRFRNFGRGPIIY
jgi:UDP-N-acetylmuramyl pentapeptide phosphotransferase/UDP-N-acetylglucosamine-1-phosphate transferase